MISYARILAPVYSKARIVYSFRVPDFPNHMIPLAVLRIDEKKTEYTTFEAVWCDSPSLCALADSERHLGYILKAGDYWLAFDATHFNEMGTDFRLLGTCRNMMSAKRAVEREVIWSPGPRGNRFKAAGAAISPGSASSQDAN